MTRRGNRGINKELKWNGERRERHGKHCSSGVVELCALRTLKLGEKQKESLQPETTDTPLSCSTGDHLVDSRGKFAQAALHHLFETGASCLLSRVSEIILYRQFCGQYPLLITGKHNTFYGLYGM